MALTDRLTALTDHMRAEQDLMVRLAENQMELRPLLTGFADSVRDGSLGIDQATRTHIRNLDVYLSRLVEDISSGRQQAVQELRSEIKLLARTIAAIAEDGER